MKQILITALFVTLAHCVFAQQNVEEFTIVKTDRGLFIKSCISDDLYADDLILPTDPSKPYKTGSKRSRQNPFVVMNAYKMDDCEYFPLRERSSEETKSFLTLITKLKTENIIVTYKDLDHE